MLQKLQREPRFRKRVLRLIYEWEQFPVVFGLVETREWPIEKKEEEYRERDNNVFTEQAEITWSLRKLAGSV